MTLNLFSALLTIALIAYYSGTKFLSIILLFPSIVLHSTMTFFMTGPLNWKQKSTKETRFAISRKATYFNICMTTASIFIIALVFESSAKDQHGKSLLGQNYSFDYSNDAYWLFWKQDSLDTYSIADGSALAKIIVLVLPPFFISITAILTLLFSSKCGCKCNHSIGILNPNCLNSQFLMKDDEIVEESYE